MDLLIQWFLHRQDFEDSLIVFLTYLSILFYYILKLKNRNKNTESVQTNKNQMSNINSFANDQFTTEKSNYPTKITFICDFF